MKCGLNFYSEGEFKTHVKACKGRVPVDLNATRKLTEAQAAAGGIMLFDEAPDTNKIAEAQAAVETERINKIRAEAAALGVKNLTAPEAELVAAVNAAIEKAKEKAENKKNSKKGE